MTKKVLYKTVHGSHLYGLNHAGSDEDFYTVLDKVRTAKAKYAKQTIHDGVDSLVVDFGTWVDSCRKGVPQALEAMFSEMPVHDEIRDFREAYYCGTEVYETYLRTIKAFCLEQDDFKKKRHGLRLALNLRDLRDTGRFNPTLSAEQVEDLSVYADWPNEAVYRLALEIAWS